MEGRGDSELRGAFGRALVKGRARDFKMTSPQSAEQTQGHDGTWGPGASASLCESFPRPRRLAHDPRGADRKFLDVVWDTASWHFEVVKMPL